MSDVQDFYGRALSLQEDAHFLAHNLSPQEMAENPRLVMLALAGLKSNIDLFVEGMRREIEKQ